MNIIKKWFTIFLVLSFFIIPQNVSALLIKRGMSGTEVKKIQTELKKLGYFNYPTATGYFGYITDNAVRAFQKDKGLVVDGIVGENTYSALFVDDNDTSSLNGAIDWFNQVQYIFPRGMNAKVTDIKTGKSFMIKRTFGTNHADVETLTKEDTEIMKEIWGEYSWERRAVVVEVDGHLIAGSMTAMPHAGVDNKPAIVIVDERSGGYGTGQNLDSVKNNGMDGHVDIHFLNSRTHGTNVVQKIHQDKVMEAAEYIEKLN
ncbi:peptidoglycan-binding domain-containing protein [Defluviitalea phaphyphila]|uniref:peptidoglycan-binding domain-containing protein n=1 Tax=Defluviitalea phaphyphila TaxID=1473580 RepID=UPI0007305D13|nr:peptidoglycan-binding domain-containing protein [Defluviitalea phaphyphila]